MTEYEKIMPADDADDDDISDEMERDARRYDMAYTEEAEVRLR